MNGGVGVGPRCLGEEADTKNDVGSTAFRAAGHERKMWSVEVEAMACGLY